MEKETLEEAADVLFDNVFGQTMNIQWAKEKAIELAKWQSERMYSDKNMIEFAKFFTQYTFIDNTSVGDLYALDETGNHPAYTMAELLLIWKNQ
jgi:hypothetical protein